MSILCKQCGIVSNNFYSYNKSTCKSCQSKNKRKVKVPKLCYCTICYRTTQEDFYISNKSTCKFCYKKKQSKRRQANPSYDKEYSKRSQQNNIFKYRIKSAKYRAKKSDLEFNITETFIRNLYDKQNGKCFYSDIPMSLIISENNYSISIDRKDSNKGYTEENIVLCAWFVNTMKNNLSLESFFIIIKEIYNNYVNTKN